MISLKRIILPVDFSTRSATAAAHARVLSRQFGATIIAVHVMRPFQLAAEGVDVPSTVVLDWYTQQRPALEAKLQEFANIYLKGCDVKLVFREGEPASEIVRAAREEDAGLILMPTHGYGAFRRFILGSVASNVLSDSIIPVLTAVHIEVPPEEKKEQIHDILVAVELDQRAPKLIGAGASLARDFGANLHVVHATPDDGVSRYMDPGWRHEIAGKVRAELEAAVKEAGATATIHVLAGDASKVVRQVAEDTGADLVVIGRHLDKSLLGRLRTHGYAIVRDSPCAVLSI